MSATPSDAKQESYRRKPARTAVVIVHGMGEQKPMETLNKFVKRALPSYQDEGRTFRHYYSRPARLAGSFEARRYLAPRHETPPLYEQTEFFEYHWSYKMTGNRFGDFLPTAVRMLVRFPNTVPRGLKGVWWILWALIVASAVFLINWLGGTDWAWLKAGAVVLAIPAIGKSVLALVRRRFGQVFTDSFVDVVRYLNRSPRSDEVRKSIRQGMVDLLQSLHDDGRYSRIILVAHSLGAYIAYDGISALWPDMSKLHCGTEGHDPTEPIPLEGLVDLQKAAVSVNKHPDSDPLTEGQAGQLDQFRENQLAVWNALRRQGNPWLVTDLITIGTPMYFADLLFTRKTSQFYRLLRTGELPTCPPQDHDEWVEPEPPLSEKPKKQTEKITFGWNNKGREVLSHKAPFAVVRWTNLFFETELGLFGDWFGGRLRRLFGTGIVDIPVKGNLPYRRWPGFAHALYFREPKEDVDESGEDLAALLRRHLRLDFDLSHLVDVPNQDPDTAITR